MYVRDVRESCECLCASGANIKARLTSFTVEFLGECYERVRKHYEKLADKHAVNGDKDHDALAKGQGQYLLKKLSAELKKRFNAKKTK